MPRLRPLTVLFLCSTLLLSFGACQKKEGPLERAGKKVDKALEKAGDKIEDVGDKIEDKADEVKEKIEDAVGDDDDK